MWNVALEKRKIVSVYYVANSEENLIRRVAAAETINTEDTVTSEEFKKQKAQEFKQSWSEKKMYEQSVRGMPENVDKDTTWQWLAKSGLKIGTEVLPSGSQEQAIMTNYVKHPIDKTNEIPLCRLLGENNGHNGHIYINIINSEKTETT